MSQVETKVGWSEEDVQLLQKSVMLVSTARDGLRELIEGWKLLQAPQVDSQHYMVVRKSDVEQLVSEVMMLREFLPSLLTPEHLSATRQLTTTEQKLQSEVQLKERAIVERTAFQRRTKAMMADYEREKQEKFTAKCELSICKQQLEQQADYCASLGSTCGTLLWRASQNEDCVHTLLSGSQMTGFLHLVGVTIQSYLSTYDDDDDDSTNDHDEKSEEVQFVLSLCGTVTNIAASAYGRDFLSSNPEGKELVQTLCALLSSSTLSPQCAKLRSLILMLLYNVSINQKGLQLLISQTNLLSVLVWIAQEDNNLINKVHSLRLIQSLILDQHTPLLAHTALEAVPIQLLESLASSNNTELQEVACELMADLKALKQQC